MPHRLSGWCGFALMAKSLDEVVEEISRRVKPAAPAADVAKATFAWMMDNIKYDHDRKQAINQGRDFTYVRRPEDVLILGKGVCGDQAALYAAICTRLGLDARFAHVTEDQDGNLCNHACALVRINDRWVQVDPAYQAFGAQHRKYYIKETTEQAVASAVIGTAAQSPWLQKAILAISAAGLLLAGSIAYQYGLPKQKANVVDTGNGLRFFTKHGSLHYRIAPDARERWEEAVFFCETLEGTLSEKELLGMLLETDRNSDNAISPDEASSAGARYRAAYLRKEH
jgi:hypothetical protein